MKPRLLSFDLDDTLWDSRSALVNAEKAVYAFLQKHCPRVTQALTPEDMIAHRREIMQERPELSHDFTQLRSAALDALTTGHGYDRKHSEGAMAEFFKHRNAVTIYDDTRAVLEELAGTFELVAVTNGNADVHAIGLGEYFRYSVSPAESGAAKPHPRMFEYVLQRSAVQAEEVIHIGDEPQTDVIGASRAGIRSVWVNRYARQWPHEEIQPDVEIHSLEALPGALAEL